MSGASEAESVGEENKEASSRILFQFKCKNTNLSPISLKLVPIQICESLHIFTIISSLSSELSRDGIKLTEDHSQPMRGQNPGHVITLDQSEAP